MTAGMPIHVRLEAGDALLRFAAGTDEGDAELLRSAFTPDATVDFGPCGGKLGLRFPPIAGRDAIVGFLAGTSKQQITSHMVANVRVIAMPDGGAEVRALVEATHVVRGEPSRRFRMLDPYTATLARHEEIWRIRRLVIDNLWFEGDPRIMLCREERGHEAGA